VFGYLTHHVEDERSCCGLVGRLVGVWMGLLFTSSVSVVWSLWQFIVSFMAFDGSARTTFSEIYHPGGTLRVFHGLPSLVSRVLTEPKRPDSPLCRR